MTAEPWFRLPDRPTLRTVLGWSLVIDALFFPVYGTVNWLTNQREDLLDLYLPTELAIPLVPEAIWVYLSMLLLFCLPIFTLSRERARNEALAAILGLFAAATIWLLLPGRLGFERVLPAGYEALYGTIFALDAPHNLVPSLHVVFSTLTVLACGQNAPGLARFGLWIWLVCIMASTLLTHQHHVLDVATGLIVAFSCRTLVLRWSMRQNISFIPFITRENIG
jgi:membrane-associated phospholipid phosphatase